MAWPLAARAQQPTMPVIGFLSSRSPDDMKDLTAGFRKGLREFGFVEDQNVAIEYRFALGQYDRLPAMVAELVRLPVTVLAATGGEPSAYAAKAATSRIPIIYTIGGNPIKEGLAASFSRPGGNMTGVTLLTNLLEPKRLGLLRELVPAATTIGFLVNASFPPSDDQIADVHKAALETHLQVRVLPASSDREIDAAFETVRQERIGAIAVAASPFFDTRRDKHVALAARYAVPTIFHTRDFIAAGGLASYGIDFADAYRLAGSYTARVLKGANPAELPVMEAVKFQFVINLKTAKTLKLEVPPSLSARADEVIE